jgi:hypothetical protein
MTVRGEEPQTLCKSAPGIVVLASIPLNYLHLSVTPLTAPPSARSRAAGLLTRSMPLRLTYLPFASAPYAEYTVRRIFCK